MEADTCLLTSSFHQDAHTPLPVEAVVSASCSKCFSSAILFEDGDLPSTRQCCLMAAKGGPKNKQIGIGRSRAGKGAFALERLFSETTRRRVECIGSESFAVITRRLPEKWRGEERVYSLKELWRKNKLILWKKGNSKRQKFGWKTVTNRPCLTKTVKQNK